MDAYKTGISVLVAEEGIAWDASTVRLVFMFAVSPDGRTIFRDVLDNLIELLGNPTNVNRLLSDAGDHHRFVRALVNLISD
jgi:lichenan operon transcriptional antiterminator